MSPVPLSEFRSGLHDDLHPFERLAARLSSSFCAVDGDDVEAAVATALEEIGAAFGVEECTLIACGGPGSTSVVQSWAAKPQVPCTNEDLAGMPWLVQRLARNAVVAFTPATQLPHASRMDSPQGAACVVGARLAVPVVVGTRVAYGLMLGTHQRHTEWRVPLIDRLRLFGEILCAGLTRVSRNHGSDAPVSADVEPTLSGDHRRGDTALKRIVGESAPLRMAVERLAQVAPLDATVLLLGETGTGKELFARALHESSPRRAKSLVSVNCAALPPTLIESELFGHERGAFTGAAGTRQGRFELADGGTLLLDEVGDLAPDLQAKLLRVLQEGEFERVGSSNTRRVDVRVVAATHVDLQAAVAAGRFRADLYYRLNVFPVRLPALRDRPEDIAPLAWSFIRRYQRSLGRRITEIPPELIETLQRHGWPGNIRELENVIVRAMICSTDGTLRLDDPLVPAVAASAVGSKDGEDVDSLDMVQRSHIERVLRECGGRINGAGNAAIRLGLHPNTLRFRIRKLGVVMPEKPGRRSTLSGTAHHGMMEPPRGGGSRVALDTRDSRETLT